METFKYILMVCGAAMLATISYALVDAFVYWIKNQIGDLKRSYNIKHRFEKQPLAKCHCIDCYYCGGYISPKVASSKEVQCTLWNGGIVIEDDSFCYRADTRKRLHDDIHRKD